MKQLQYASVPERLKKISNISNRDIQRRSSKIVKTAKQYEQWKKNPKKYDLPRVDDGTLKRKALVNAMKYWLPSARKTINDYYDSIRFDLQNV